MIARYSEAFSEPTYRKTFIASENWLAASADITSVLIGEVDDKRDLSIDASRAALGNGGSKLPPLHRVTDRIIEKRAAALQLGGNNIATLADSSLDVNAHRRDLQQCLHFIRELRFDAGLQAGQRQLTVHLNTAARWRAGNHLG